MPPLDGLAERRAACRCRAARRARRHQGQLHQRRAVEAEAGPPAPKIGHIDEAFSDGDEVRFRRRLERSTWAATIARLPSGDQAELGAAGLDHIAQREALPNEAASTAGSFMSGPG